MRPETITIKSLRYIGLVSVIVFGLLVCAGCGSGDGGGGDQTLHEAEATIGPEGGVITTYSEMSLIIPPNALEEDTKITITDLDIEALNGDPGEGLSDVYITGGVFEPHGLVFKTPVKLIFALPPDWQENEIPILQETNDEDPTTALPTGVDIAITGEYGAFNAEAEIKHFSTKILSRNCHAGALKAVMLNFESRGCSRDRMFKNVFDRYGIEVDENHAKSTSPRYFQAFIDTYFEDFGSFDRDVDLDADQVQQLMEYAKNGRQVVLAFSCLDQWRERSGDNDNFFPSNVYAHTAVLEVDREDKVLMHHWFPKPTVLNPRVDGAIKLLNDLGGEWHYTYPMDKINEYRTLQKSVAFELYICEINSMTPDPGCLSNVNRNPYKLNLLNPLDGYSDWCGNETMPRPVAYPSMHIYIESAGGPPNDPCNVLVAYYPFNGTANDESGNGHHGSVYGATLTTDRFGRQNSAYNFSGTDYIYCSGVPQSPVITLIAWFKTGHDYSSAYGRIIESASASGFIMGKGSYANRLNAFLETGYDDWNQSITSTTYNDDRWHMAAITYDGTRVNAYIDGQRYNSVADTGDLDYDGNGLWIGRFWADESDYFYGSIDDIMIFDKALTETHIQTIYNQ